MSQDPGVNGFVDTKSQPFMFFNPKDHNCLLNLLPMLFSLDSHSVHLL